jgi:hypothetical protein
MDEDTMSYAQPIPRQVRQVVDWSAAVWAGLIAGAAFLVANLLLTPMILGGNAWVSIRLLASITMGKEILAPPATFDALALVMGLTTHFALSIVFAMVVAFVVHRWGVIFGIVGGALLGLFLYWINFYTVTLIFPQFFPMRGGGMFWGHILYGALTGFLYEAFEIEEFVPVETKSAQEA